MLWGRLQCDESQTESFPELLTITSPIWVETHCGCQKSAGNVSSHKILSQNYLCQATINLFNLISNFPKKIIKKKNLVELVVYFWGFYDIKFKLTQYKSKLGLIPQYTFDLREFDITNLKFGSNTTIYLAQHVTLTNYKPKPGLIPQHTKQTSLY